MSCFRTKLVFSDQSEFKASPNFTEADSFCLGFTGGIAKSQILSNTTAGWNSQPSLVSRKNFLYVYTDYQQVDDGQGNMVNVPGIKIGDGNAYVIDLPFIDLKMEEHINDLSIHVTALEKAFWNNKVSAYIEYIDEDNLNLVLSTDY